MTRSGIGRVGALAALAAGAVVAARTAARLRRRIDFTGKVAVVTGGSRGLGLVLARQLVDQGAHVAICARDADELERARAELAGRGGRGDVLAITCDVADRDQVVEMLRQVRQAHRRIDILINNAGIIEVGPLETMTVHDFEATMDIHFWGPLHAILAVLPSMRRSGGGRIVNITSIGGKLPAPHLLPYVASKFAIVGLSEALRTELNKDRIYVTTVCPGLMRTGSPRNALFKGQHRAEYAWFKIGDSLPLISMGADRAAEEILEACRYGDAELILSTPAKLGVWFHGLFPGLTSDIAALVNRVLPGPGGVGEQSVRGFESKSRWSESMLTRLTDDAARRNNEMP